MDVNFRGAQAATPFVTEIDYDAKGQRTLIEYGNNVKTEYAHDPLTLRLTNLKTTRINGPGRRFQELELYLRSHWQHHRQIQDNAQQTIYYNNQVVTPINDYTYDAIYRLIHAEGHGAVGQAFQRLRRPGTIKFQIHLPHPGDGQAMRRYTEQYEYDSVGNFLQLIHVAANGNWTARLYL